MPINTYLAIPGLPNPEAYFPYANGIIEKGDSTLFGWRDTRYAPVAYELQVDDSEDFQSPRAQVTCMAAEYDLQPGLPPGQYFWRVRAKAGDLVSVWSIAHGFSVIELPTSASGQGVTPRAPSLSPGTKQQKIAWFTQNPVLKPHKDTRMLCLECEFQQGAHAWDDRHITSGLVAQPCGHELGYLGVATIALVNRYYGGTVAQDELMFDFWEQVKAGPEEDLGHGESGWAGGWANPLVHALAVEGGQAIGIGTIALDCEGLRVVDCWAERGDAWWKITAALDKGIPLVGSLYSTAGSLRGEWVGQAVVYGYFETITQSSQWVPILYVLDPGVGQGARSLFLWDVVWTAALAVPDAPPSVSHRVRKRDPDLARDSDGDGLCDFDEIMRFHTLETERDTDGDGIDDKTEVWSYKFGKGFVGRSADSDGDGVRTELDEDRDDDGCEDGEEDRNHNGSLYYPGGLVLGVNVKEQGETDPFWVDEFKLTLSAERTTLRFTECTRLEVKLTDKGGDPVKDALIRVKFDPMIGTFGTPGAPPVTTAFVQTDQDGKAAADFCAEETQGGVLLEARYLPCPKGKEAKAEIQLVILPYDWIFAVQEKAVLTGPTLTNYTVSIGDSFGLHWGQSSHIVFKDADLQRVSGHFYHPKAKQPGLYINTVKVRGGHAELLIDGQRVGQSWARTNQLQAPQQWEVRVALTGSDTLPRYLQVATIGGPERLTPLVWWRTCGVTGLRYRSATPSIDLQFKVLFRDFVDSSYDFFFGDGDADGRDPVWTWPKEKHTGVGFIPVAGMPGREVGTGGWTGAPPPADWSQKVGGEYGFWNNFQYDKVTVYFSWPPAPWTVTAFTEGGYLLKEDLESAGPLPVGPLLNTIRFKRDYIGSELKELQARKITAPEYEIRMLPEE